MTSMYSFYKLENNKLIILIMLSFTSFMVKAQEFNISGFTVSELSNTNGLLNNQYEVNVSLPELSHGLTLEVQVGLDSSCVGVFTDFFHIKNYSGSYYLKHHGERIPAEGKDIHFLLEVDDGFAGQDLVFCLKATSGNGSSSNTLHYKVTSE